MFVEAWSTYIIAYLCTTNSPPGRWVVNPVEAKARTEVTLPPLSHSCWCGSTRSHSRHARLRLDRWTQHFVLHVAHSPNDRRIIDSTARGACGSFNGPIALRPHEGQSHVASRIEFVLNRKHLVQIGPRRRYVGHGIPCPFGYYCRVRRYSLVLPPSAFTEATQLRISPRTWARWLGLPTWRNAWAACG